MASRSSTRSDDVLIRANIFLSHRKLTEAINLYTEILYAISPGHVCALLNRALAYVCLQRPELAVVDAYRAAIAAYGIREDDIQANDRYKDVCRYIRTEREHVERDNTWTSDRRRFIGANWARSPLSSIVINDTPESTRPNDVKVPPFFPKNRQEVCQKLELRAIYRLAAALSLCGGGARSDAFGILDDARARHRKTGCWEMFYYKNLGNNIMIDLMKDWETSGNRPSGLGLMSLQTNAEQDQDIKQTIKDEMKSKATMMNTHSYPFDSYEPELNLNEWQKIISPWVKNCAKTCSAHVITPVNSQRGSSKPYLELRALQDINPEENVLFEQTDSNVTTSTPESIMANSSLDSTDHFYCDTCAALLVVPGRCRDNYSGSTVPIQFRPSNLRQSPNLSPTLSSKSLDSNLADRADSPEMDDSVIDPILFSGGHERKTSATSPNHSDAGDTTSSMSSDFMFCCTTHKVPTCSDRCRKRREIFDRGLCHTNIERELRKGQLQDLRAKTFEERKFNCLRELLFLRTFIMTLNSPGEDSHPLHHDDILFAAVNPNNSPKEGEKQSWSFTNNVIRPIYDIHQVCAYLDIDPFTILKKTDGWVINTLMSKISNSMRVSRGPRYAKIYNNQANLKTAFGKFDDRWSNIAHTDDPDEETWIGSINPVFNLIRVADPSKGEVPNVVVVQKSGLHVYAISAIEKGQALLRAADGAEWPKPEDWMLTADDEGESGENEEGGEQAMDTDSD
ncbi:hypothetical protein OEA41_007194 [Lepraria neglecta]|uniref:Uncharacterized protein n=1 Tax=Lepraria neglecta TaxID=209136 RepID=A0AAE0DN13_9LECA|nr:hypothetical protein OEA41_007194 [Lepraria neglecta]